MDTYNAYTHTYAHVYIHSNVYAFLQTLHAFIYSYIHIQYTQTCIYMHKYKRMRIHTHRHKISVPFCFLQNVVPIYTHINYIPPISMEIIRFKLQYDHFLVHLLMY